jgi:hypothetical protein
MAGVVWYAVTIEHNGKLVSGRYCTNKGLVTVSYGGETDRARFGGSSEATAKIMMRELIRKIETAKGK